MVRRTSGVPSESASTSSTPVARDLSPTPPHATYLNESFSITNAQNSNRAAEVVSPYLALYFTDTTTHPTFLVSDPFLPPDASALSYPTLNPAVPVLTPVPLGGYHEIHTHLRPQPAYTVIDIERTTPLNLTDYWWTRNGWWHCRCLPSLLLAPLSSPSSPLTLSISLPLQQYMFLFNSFLVV